MKPRLAAVAGLVALLTACPSVDGTPPGVTLEGSTTVTTAGLWTATANVTDSSGINRVEFFEGDKLLGTDSSAPFSQSVTFTAAQNGTRLYSARAFDIAGNQGEGKLTVTVNIADTTKPTVTLDTSASSVASPGSVTLTAAASDDIGVTKVEFYKDDTLVGTDDKAPFAYSFNAAFSGNGSSNYTAKAFDAAGNSATSDAVNITVNIPDDASPTVALSSTDTNVTIAGDQTLTAVASDNVAVTKVEFYVGSTLLGTDSSAPFTQVVTYGAVNNGSYTYTAKAFDSATNTTSSNELNVVVNVPDTTAPTVSLSSSTNPVVNTSAITLTATAGDDVGVARVEFYKNNALVSTDSSAPYELVQSFVAADSGAYSYTARAFDATGNNTTSSALDLSVAVPDTTAPTISLSSSSNPVTSNAAITLSATVSDDIGVVRVKFFENGVEKLEDATAPFTAPALYNAVNNGSKTWTATAFDAAGNTTTATLELSVTVPDTTAPTVALVTVVSPNGVVLNVTATDDIGVTRVDFYNDTTLLSADTTAPYSFTLSLGIAGGEYSNLRAVAVDAANNEGNSNLVQDVWETAGGVANNSLASAYGLNVFPALTASSGFTLSAAIETGDVDFYSFNATFGQVIKVTTITGGTNLDTIIRLYDPSGAQVDFNDEDSLAASDSSISYNVTSSGVYTLKVEAAIAPGADKRYRATIQVGN
jgi:Bacterial Ig domain/Bacterial pre-peptidase C-terminal domain